MIQTFLAKELLKIVFLLVHSLLTVFRSFKNFSYFNAKSMLFLYTELVQANVAIETGWKSVCICELTEKSNQMASYISCEYINIFIKCIEWFCRCFHGVFMHVHSFIHFAFAPLHLSHNISQHFIFYLYLYYKSSVFMHIANFHNVFACFVFSLHSFSKIKTKYWTNNLIFPVVWFCFTFSFAFRAIYTFIHRTHTRTHRSPPPHFATKLIQISGFITLHHIESFVIFTSSSSNNSKTIIIIIITATLTPYCTSPHTHTHAVHVQTAIWRTYKYALSYSMLFNDIIIYIINLWWSNIFRANSIEKCTSYTK